MGLIADWTPTSRKEEEGLIADWTPVPAGERREREERAAADRQPKKKDIRREVTYDVFAHEIWPKIAKKAQVPQLPFGVSILFFCFYFSFLYLCLCGFLSWVFWSADWQTDTRTHAHTDLPAPLARWL